MILYIIELSPLEKSMIFYFFFIPKFLFSHFAVFIRFHDTILLFIHFHRAKYDPSFCAPVMDVIFQSAMRN